ncbi:Ligand-binding domain of nuclear hormone receptor [Ancylostoma caninum]|uniref:Ligand-binding domain of nuclear hormone receptor n=1 Tax=Ancylostoma caninum TaxID=29170 RepID=A0A368FUP4_ANCCA|nr:Ligand-binding domain of nuclear hormone receptor [Ancylostoma caninum]
MLFKRIRIYLFRSCKIFFVRSVHSSNQYLCENGGRCIVNKETRNNCKACRFTKCLQANMAEQDVGRFRKNSRLLNRTNSVVPYFRENYWKVRLNEISDVTSIGIHFLQGFEKAPRAMDYAKTLVYIERLCDNTEASRSPFTYSLNTTLADVLERPDLCCARTPIGWNEDEFVEQNNILDILKQVYCRTITHFADFAAGCPELQMLEAKDRLAVCSNNFCGVILFLLVYNAYINNCEGILFPHGFKYTLSMKHEDHEYHEFLHELVDYMHRNVVKVFREIQITVEEYTFVKILLLFSGVMALTDIGSEIVSKARRKYGALLSEYVVTSRPDLTPAQQIERVARLHSIVPYMVVCAAQK